MGAHPADDRDHNGSATEVDESDVARCLARYVGREEEVRDETLRSSLQRVSPGAVVSVARGDPDVFVVVEWSSPDDGRTIRDLYGVRAAPTPDGDPELRWMYLGLLE